MTIYFDQKPQRTSDVIVFCNDEPQKGIKHTNFDVRDLINESQNELTNVVVSIYLKLHAILKTNVKAWHFSSISRLLIWSSSTKSYQVRDVYIALAIAKLSKLSGSDIYVVGASESAARHIAAFVETHALKGLNAKKVTNGVLLNYFLSLIQQIAISSVFFVLNHWRSPKRKDNSLGDYWVITTRFDQRPSKKPDHFFGDLFQKTPGDQLRTTWVYDNFRFFPLSDLEPRTIGHESRYENTLLFAHVRIADIIKAISEDIRLHREFRALEKSHKFWSSISETSEAFVAKTILAQVGSSSSSYSQILRHYAFKRMIERKRPKVIFYPYEGKVAEATLLAAVSASGAKINTVGFAHACYSNGHLFTKYYSVIPELMPKIFAVTGQRPANFFQSAGVPKARIVKVGSSRYKELVCDSPPLWSRNSKRLRVLFISSLGFEYLNFAKMLVRYPELSKSFDIFIRRSPHSWKFEQDYGDEMLANAGVHFGRADADLSEEILASDVVLFEFTTAAYQASLLGRLIAKVKVFETFETAHFEPGLSAGDYLDCCLDGDGLLDMLSEVSEWSIDYYRAVANSQREAVCGIYEPANFLGFESFIYDK